MQIGVPISTSTAGSRIKRLATLLCGFGLCTGLLLADTHYVSLSGDHISSFTNWAGAATNIQDAIGAANAGDIVLVTNGVYDTGWTETPGYSVRNRVFIDRAITVRSVNGPGVTFIVGQGPHTNTAVRCTYVGANARIEGFTLTNGYTRASGDYDKERSGGGAWCAVSATVSNCVMAGNSVDTYGGGTYCGSIQDCIITGNSAAEGGGAYAGTIEHSVITGNSAFHGGGLSGGIIRNSIITGNSALYTGGGMVAASIQNSTITGNSAGYGGGTYYGVVTNSIVYYNSADESGDNWYSGTYGYSCTMPDPGGTGNITNDPCLVDYAAGNHRSASNSSCIDSGTNQPWMLNATDLGGDLRIIDGAVDMGAYEFLPLPSRIVSYEPIGGIITNWPEFVWCTGANASWYQLWIEKDGVLFLSRWLNGLTDYTHTLGLSFGRYQWRVRAWNKTGYGMWSDWTSFSHGDMDPVSPAGIVDDTRHPLFSWTAVERAAWYYLWVDRNGVFYARQWVNGTNRWAPDHMLPGGTYRWWGRAWNADGYGPWSGASEFVIPTVLPGRTILRSPPGLFVTTNRPVFAWDEVQQATWYRLWISRDKESYVSKWLQNTTYVPPAAILSGSYRWWVQTWGVDGYGPWSDAADFSYGVFPDFLVDLWGTRSGSK